MSFQRFRVTNYCVVCNINNTRTAPWWYILRVGTLGPQATDTKVFDITSLMWDHG